MLAWQQTIQQENTSFLVERMFSSAKALLIQLAQQKLSCPILILSGGTRKENWLSDLSFFCQKTPLELPSWEILPSEKISPSFDIMGKRLSTLYALTQEKAPLVITPITSFLQRILPSEKLKQNSYTWKLKEEIPFDWILSFLQKLGYQQKKVVTDKGDFAVRGGIIDLFPSTSYHPFRLEFFSDELESIRIFDPGSQKSIQKVSELFFTFANEKLALQEEENLCTLFDYFSSPPLVIFDDLLAVEDAYTSFLSLPGIPSRFFTPLSDLLLPRQRQKNIFFSKEPLESLLPFQKGAKSSFFQEITLEYFSLSWKAKRFFSSISSIDSFWLGSPYEEAPLLDRIGAPSTPKMDWIFIVDTAEKQRQLEKKLTQQGVSSFHFQPGYITQGFLLNDIPLGLIGETDFTGVQRIRREKWRNITHVPHSDFPQLLPGDFVVHFHSGIGKYLGCETHTNHQGITSEFLAIEYAEKSKLYVPISQSYLVSKYIGASEAAPTLHPLGTKRWQQLKTKAQKQIVGYAANLLKLYAQREVEEGISYPSDTEDMHFFEQTFPYEETEDQKKAIQETKEDMQKPKPMDRLILGDVGFGKTEVAIRAAFKAILEGKKQVAILVPTTVLALQHYDSFRERMSSYPIRIEVICRTNTPKKNREILKKVQEGKIDLLIGTHRILSKDVAFADLGLIIIDEEQRFGVKAKEHLKTLKQGIDCLTLSATPIPRTLYMSLIQIRPMSIIHTPPQDRLPVQTILAENEDSLIHVALLRELAREGQAFFIHNRIESIYQRASHIQKLLPQATIAVVHGQMDPEEIDTIFHQFKQGKIHLLFATSIIENGIDVPNANTIIIDHADRFGLADLYQLRGRVGRWNRSAYAYFLTPKKVAEPARKRLSAFLEAGGYGGGMKIAMRDLELRGAGDLLGVEQSGQVNAIGFHLYCKLLKKAISSLRKEIPSPFIETSIDFPFDAKIPESYLSDSNLRMEFYHRLGEATSYQETEEILQELKDRFGPYPSEVLWLYHMTRIRLAAYLQQFSSVKFTPTHIFLTQEKTGTRRFAYPKFSDPDLLERFFLEILQKNYPA